MKTKQKKLTISIDIDTETLTHALSEHHGKDWKDWEKPTEKECIKSLKNECVSWLEDLNIDHKIFVKSNQKECTKLLKNGRTKKQEIKYLIKTHGMDKLKSILKSENSEEFDAGYYFGLIIEDALNQAEDSSK